MKTSSYSISKVKKTLLSSLTSLFLESYQIAIGINRGLAFKILKLHTTGN